MSTALLFPGQGSQKVGMGKALAQEHTVAKQAYEEADDALGFAISKLCWDGPDDQLTLTKFTQPAILTTSIAVFRVLEARGTLAFDYVAGHSLGEWSALVAVQALSLADAVRLTHLRGQYMQEAVPVGQGAMAALMGLSLDAVTALCAASAADGEPVSAANLNGGGQVVISGHANAVDRAVAGAKPAGAKLAKKLQVSAPFHCALMQPAADRLATALAPIHVQRPTKPLVANVTADVTDDAARIKQLLVQQVTAPVRWEESVQTLAKLGVTRAIECGPGGVLKGLVKRIADTIEVLPAGDPAELAAIA